MRIRVLVVAGTLAAGIVTAGSLAGLLVAANNIQSDLGEAEAADTIVRAVFERSSVLDDYLLRPSERARIQWESRHASLGRFIDDFLSTGALGDPIWEEMRVAHRKTSDAFSRLVDVFENRLELPRSFGAISEVEERRAAQLRLASVGMSSLAGQLAGRARNEARENLVRSAMLIAALVACMVVTLAGMSYFVGWRVVQRMALLQQGIRDYAGGQLETHGTIQGNDEIADIARSFERMAENLKTVLVSKDELTAEVELRREAEKEAKDLAADLEQRGKDLHAVNKELEAFAYSVSHDLRAPLRHMVGFCEALVEDYGDGLDDTAKDYVGRISAASIKMGKLIDDLLRLSRVTRVQVNRKEVDLSKLAQNLAADLLSSDGKRKVEFKIEPDLVAEADETLITTVLENLLGNAWKYSSKKPHATIEMGRSTNGTEPAYFVRDNGAGFDMAYADKLFQPFQRLHGESEFEGTGIGLASVANILRRHGGRIWAESTLGEGATMHFTL